MTKYLILIFSIFFISGCSFPVQIYLLNLSKNNIELRCFFRDNHIQVLMYSSNKLVINENTLNECKDQLKGELKLNYHKFILPPESTIYLGKGMNFKNILMDSINIYRNEKLIETINWDDSNKFQKGSTSGLPKDRWMWYEIK